MACLCSHQHSSPLEAPHPTPDHYWLLLLFSVTMDSFLYSTVVAMSCPPHVLLAICFCLIPAYSVRVGPIQQALAKIPLVTVFRGGHFCVTVPCLYHLQQSFDVQQCCGNYSLQIINYNYHYLATLRTITFTITPILQVINSHYNYLKAITITITIALGLHELRSNLQK